MTKEEFAELQHRHLESGKSLKEYLRQFGVCYSTYSYWRRKYLAAEEPHELAPICFRVTERSSTNPLPFSNDLSSGTTLLFPNGLRAHLGSGTESMLKDLFEKSLASHVLP